MDLRCSFILFVQRLLGERDDVDRVGVPRRQIPSSCSSDRMLADFDPTEKASSRSLYAFEDQPGERGLAELVRERVSL